MRIMRGVHRRKRLASVLLAVAVCGVGAAIFVVARAGGTARAAAVTPVAVTEVPSTLPSTGVEVNGQAILQPLASVPTNAISASEAISDARALVNAHPYPATALLASLTLPNSIPVDPSSGTPATTIEDVPAWMITFTSPEPVDVAVGGPAPADSAPMLVTHLTVAIDASSGQFLGGFFTK